jgi:D-amino peptidase
LKIYVMTDLEGVAGVLDFEGWCVPEGRYFDLAKEFLTLEVNAAVQGFFEAGAREVVVADGHGKGGINPDIIDPRVELMRWWPTGYPLLLDESYDAVAWVGQHAKAGTPYAHISHTQWFPVIDYTVNGVSIGEFGQTALCANELGIRSIFGSGDLAFTEEAQALFPGIETVCVKRGTTPDSGDELSSEDYMRRNYAAIHIPPKRACELIFEGAYRAVERLQTEDFGLIEMKPPYERVIKLRQDSTQPRKTYHAKLDGSFAELMNLPWDTES